MSRNKRGQFKPGFCGNPKGRPRKQPREISPRQIRKTFFALGEMPVTVVEGGKRKTITADEAIDKQLLMKAVAGERWALQLYHKRRDKLVLEYFDEQTSLLKTYVETEKLNREFPEEVTEKLLEVMRDTRALLDPGFQP